MRMSTKFIWIRIGSNSGLSGTELYKFEVHEKQKIFHLL
jgi:hypothetical protein